jgi:hypothetical protein
MNVVKVFQRKLRATTQNSDILVVNRTTTAIIAAKSIILLRKCEQYAKPDSSRDLIVGLQKGLALIQLFSKEPPAHRAAGGENERPDAKRRAAFSLRCCTSAICKPTDAITG